ncbi:VOC family protein [Streptomyces sp. A5-4]|uniref:VOC family protein n=1 Tax=Streptomyces sp. A5-4 TaxID=3384771 RepID=UPI003DA89154
MFKDVRIVMVFADAPEISARWWGQVLDAPVKTDVSNTGAVYAWVQAGSIELGFHPADTERNAPGGSPVVYWGVDDLDQARDHLLGAGCDHHRGPLLIEPGRRIAQLRDPFGTIIGIEGP